jgi:hypothetical protein
MVRQRARHHRGRLRHAEEEVAAIWRRRRELLQRGSITCRELKLYASGKGTEYHSWRSELLATGAEDDRHPRVDHRG